MSSPLPYVQCVVFWSGCKSRGIRKPKGGSVVRSLRDRRVRVDYIRSQFGCKVSELVRSTISVEVILLFKFERSFIWQQLLESNRPQYTTEGIRLWESLLKVSTRGSKMTIYSHFRSFIKSQTRDRRTQYHTWIRVSGTTLDWTKYLDHRCPLPTPLRTLPTHREKLR